MAERTSTVTTWALARDLPSGATTWAPVVAPSLCAFGDGDGPADELRVFLAEHLATAPAAQVARYFVPAGLEVVAIAVPLAPGAPTKPRSPRDVEVTCVLLPYGPEGRDRVALVPALDAAFFVDRKEEVGAVARREVQQPTTRRAGDAPCATRRPSGPRRTPMSAASPSARPWWRWLVVAAVVLAAMARRSASSPWLQG